MDERSSLFDLFISDKEKYFNTEYRFQSLKKLLLMLRTNKLESLCPNSFFFPVSPMFVRKSRT
jgi:hypothetical protein